MIEGLTLELDSHLSMSMLGWKYPASRHEIYDAITAARVVGATLGKNEKPLVLDLPWDTAKAADSVTPEEREALAKKLRARSAFAQKRMEP
ncbi:hypothetical protein [Pseudarthrobacter sp. PS3-L1]|uniref:hypothetical protein n=1 Tax=Pseudarthrobacter sp. PS3-L1 TaxID=3046207 RepID=UPI0024B9FE3F|nr:hypothetical protein [Pseudarthrobacter sp. PS3-L1]MDJ0321657.1 hypothetical protein [Pseudarthrobacter sp. PS3-L1]